MHIKHGTCVWLARAAVILDLLPWVWHLNGYELNMWYVLHKTVLPLSSFFAQTMNKFIGLCTLCMKIQSLRITFCLSEPELFPGLLRTFRNWKTSNCGCGINRERKKKRLITAKIFNNRIESWEWDGKEHFTEHCIPRISYSFLHVADLWHVRDNIPLYA